MIKNILFSFLFLSILYSCTEKTETEIPTGVVSFKVESSVKNSSDNLFEIPIATAFETTLTITALDYFGNVLTDYNGDIIVTSSRGTVSSQTEATFTNGVATSDITLLYGYGPTRVVVSDNKSENWPVGTTDPIYFRELKIFDTQYPSNNAVPIKSPFENIYAKVTTGNMFVAHVSGTGMYLVDLTDPEDYCMLKDQSGDYTQINPDFRGFNSMYIYSRNTPENYTDGGSTGVDVDDFREILPGQRVEWFAGNLVEFNDMTEISFPTWKIESLKDELKESHPDWSDDQITAEVLRIVEEQRKNIPICKFDESYFPAGNNDFATIKKLEPFESNIVTVQNVKIGDYDSEYSQWNIHPASSTSKVLRVVSKEAIPVSEFNPEEKKGQTLQSVTGVLQHVYGGIWVIYVRNINDIVQ
ncbi:Ig-like domain-containing protein [bacterium]|nr:Ig-like domain-containing protein [bacterium]